MDTFNQSKDINRIWKLFDEITDDLFYQTPYEFFEDSPHPRPADKVKGVVYVKDKHFHTQPVRATGIHITLPRIPGVGVIRQRYPIMPVYGEVSYDWQEMAVVEDIIKNSEKYFEVLSVCCAL